MNKGDIFNRGFKVGALEDGSFVVHAGSEEYATILIKAWGFSNIGDLLHWLDEEAHAWQKLKHPLDSSNG